MCSSDLDALRTECGNAAERGDERERDEQEAGARPEPVRDGDARREEPCGVEERHDGGIGRGLAARDGSRLHGAPKLAGDVEEKRIR